MVIDDPFELTLDDDDEIGEEGDGWQDSAGDVDAEIERWDHGISTRYIRRWSDRRLVREFRYFRHRYWPGRLLDFTVTADVTEQNQANRVAGWPSQWWGRCDYDTKRILMHLPEHRSDHNVRSTLLHELCHAAAAPRSRGHDIYFFWEVERLFALGAPIRVDFLKYEEGHDVDPDLIDLLPRCAAIREKQKARRASRVITPAITPF